MYLEKYSRIIECASLISDSFLFIYITVYGLGMVKNEKSKVKILIPYQKSAYALDGDCLPAPCRLSPVVMTDNRLSEKRTTSSSQPYAG